MKYLIVILAVLLLLSGAANYIQYRAAAKAYDAKFGSNRSDAEHLEKIAVLERKKKEYADSITALVEKVYETDSVNKVKVAKQEKAIAWYKERERAARPTIKFTSGVHFTLVDSTYSKYDSLVKKLKSDNQTNIKDFNELLSFEQLSRDISDSIARKERHRGDSLKQVSEDAVQELDDEQDKQFGFGLSVGYGGTVYENKVVTGPTVNLGFVWRPNWTKFSLKRRKK
jgi:hypothetical protein